MSISGEGLGISEGAVSREQLADKDEKPSVFLEFLKTEQRKNSEFRIPNLYLLPVTFYLLPVTFYLLPAPC